MAEDTQTLDFIHSVFEDKLCGLVVDVGAFYWPGGVGSISYQLLTKGWGGVLIDPMTEAWERFNEDFKNNPKVHCVKCGCADYDGHATLYPFKTVSTMNKDWADACSREWDHVHYGEPITIDVFRLSTLFQRLKIKGPIDLLSIDTEGSNLQVLKGMDWSYRPRVICIESLDMTHLENRNPDHSWNMPEETHAYLVDHGYHLNFLTKTGNAVYETDTTN